MGKCAKGKQCPWAHDESELKAAPDLRCTKLCREMMNKGKCTKANCNFAHSNTECRGVKIADGTTRKLTKFSALMPGPLAEKKKATSKAVKVGQTSAMGVPKYVPLCLNANAPEFVPDFFTSEVPAFMAMPSPPPEVALQSPEIYTDANLEFISGSLASEAPALAPMFSPPPGLPAPPPGLEDYVSYSANWDYSTFNQEESESDCSSYEGIKTEANKIDGTTPITEILAMFPKPGQASPSPSTAASLVDLHFFPEEQNRTISARS